MRKPLTSAYFGLLRLLRFALSYFGKKPLTSVKLINKRLKYSVLILAK